MEMNEHFDAPVALVPGGKLSPFALLRAFVVTTARRSGDENFTFHRTRT